jgi:uncharacterized protein (DUF1330 family)
MAAYVIVDVEVMDPAAYEEYKLRVPATLAAFGGRFLVRGGKTETLEGDWAPKRLVILQFDSMERAKEWWRSEMYSAAKEIRYRTANSRMIVAEGV